MDILSKESINFAYLDFYLPRGKTGLDVLHYIRLNKLPVRSFIVSEGLFSSDDGYLERDKMLQCIDAGAMGYLSKVLEGDNILRESFDLVDRGISYLPNGCIKSEKKERGQPKTLEEMGIKGRLCETLYYLDKGHPSKIIAKLMGITDGAVRDYSSEIKQKVEAIYPDVSNIRQVLIKINQLGIVIPTPKSDTNHN